MRRRTAYSETSVDDVQVGPLEMQLSLHARDIGVGEARSVDVVYEEPVVISQSFLLSPVRRRVPELVRRTRGMTMSVLVSGHSKDQEKRDERESPHPTSELAGAPEPNPPSRPIATP